MSHLAFQALSRRIRQFCTAQRAFGAHSTAPLRWEDGSDTFIAESKRKRPEQSMSEQSNSISPSSLPTRVPEHARAPRLGLSEKRPLTKPKSLHITLQSIRFVCICIV